MGLQLKINAKENHNSFTVYDCTGLQSNSNPNGWGYPNPKIEDATNAYIEVYPPLTTTPIIVNLYSDFPRTDGIGYEILPYQVNGSNDEIQSGVWLIRYVVEGVDKNGIAYKKKTEQKFVFTKTAQCCVDNMFKKVNKDAFKDNKQRKAVELNVLMSAALSAAECGLYGEASNILDHINQQCACCNCS